MAERDDRPDTRREAGQASRRHGGGYSGTPGYGRGYGRDFGGGGPNQGFDGSHGQGYGGGVGPTDYREGFGGEAHGGGMQAADYARSFGGRGEDFGGDDRNWIDERADHRAGASNSGRGPKGWTRSDRRIWEEVCERLMHDRLLDARSIEVEVQDGVVSLTGDVPGASDAPHAEMLARGAPGVKDVVNQLRHIPGRREIDRNHDEAQPEGQRTRWGKWVPPFAT